MSVLEHLPALQTAVSELRKIQRTRKKVNMNEGIFIGLATKIRSFKTEEQCEEQNQVQVSIVNILEKLHLVCGYTLNLPFDLIDYGRCSNNIVTVYLKEDDHCPFKKIIFEMPSIREVDFIDKVKLPQKPRPNTYQHDGLHHLRIQTPKGVDNSFDSDDPSATEDL